MRKPLLPDEDLERASLSYAQSALMTPGEPSSGRTTDLAALRSKCASDYETYKNNVAAAAKAKEQQRKARELEHQLEFRLHVDVRAIDYNTVNLRYFSDVVMDGSEVLISGDAKHIDGNEVVRLELEWPEEPSMLKVTVNGRTLPTTSWDEQKDPQFITRVGTKYIATIREN
jgi:hypothetical protein